MRHGALRFGYEPDDWDRIKASWSLIDFDPYEPDDFDSEHAVDQLTKEF